MSGKLKKEEALTSQDVYDLVSTLEDVLRRIGMNLALVHRDCVVLRNLANDLREKESAGRH